MGVFVRQLDYAVVATVIVAAVPASIVQAQPTAPEAEINAAFAAAEKVAVRGPATVKLVDQATLALPAGQVFIPAGEANRIMRALGNTRDPSRFGLVLGTAKDDSWIVDVSWTKEGYVRDGDAREWQADALLESLREGTEHANEERRARGFPAMEILGWVQPPRYDPATHRLVWSLLSRDKGAPANAVRTINYNTYALGREGYFSLDLITDAARIETDKHVALDLLGSLEYQNGKRYADFNGSTDKVAAYGLAALVGAVAVKKLGLLAVIGVFLLKAWKLLIIGFVAGGAAIRRWFKKPENPAE